MAAEGPVPNQQDLYLGLFPKGQSFTEESLKSLQDLLNRQYFLLEEGVSPRGIEFLNLFMFNDLPGILGPSLIMGDSLEVIHAPFLTKSMRVVLEMEQKNAANKNLIGLINMERVKQDLKEKRPMLLKLVKERRAEIEQEIQKLTAKLSTASTTRKESIQQKIIVLQRLDMIADTAESDDTYLYSTIGRELPFKTLAQAQENFRSYKASAEEKGATKILLPVNKLYIDLNERNAMGIDDIKSNHANHLLIDLATKKYMLIEPQMPAFDPKKRIQDQFFYWAHYRILDRLGDDLIKPVFGDEFESVEVARGSCPQSIVRDKNCIWWSFMLSYLYISNMETTDINYIGKKIVSKYGAELPDLMNSFKVFCVGRILKRVREDPEWAGLAETEFVRGLQGLTLAAAGGGRRTKLMRRGRSTRKHHKKRHGKRTLRSS